MTDATADRQALMADGQLTAMPVADALAKDKRIAELESRVADLTDILDMRNAAIDALCIAVHGVHKPELSIYDLIIDVASMRERSHEPTSD